MNLWMWWTFSDGRNSLPEIVNQAVKIKAKVLWMQLGVSNEEAANKARQAGMTVVQDHCMMAEHSRLIGKK